MASDEFQLEMGGKKVNFHKSQTAVGIRAKPGRARDMAGIAASAGAEATPEVLGNFQMVNVDPEASVEDTLGELRADTGVEAGTHVYYTSDDQVPFTPNGHIYVELTDQADPDYGQEILDRFKLEVLPEENLSSKRMTLRVTKNSPNPLKVAEALQQDQKNVSVAEPEFATPGKLHAFILPSDALLDRQWHLRNTGKNGGATIGLAAGADARVLEAWEVLQGVGDPGVTVAVIDDGFDLSHPDFAGPGKTVAPWDFTRNTSDPSPEFTATYPAWNAANQEWAGDWHGTACAGVALGSANSSGILGSAPGCRFMPVRWGVDLSPKNVEAWFDYVRTQGAAVVSCSWGAEAWVFPLHTRIKRAIERCGTEGRGGKGCVICFAAGNEDRDVDNQAGGSLNGFAIHPNVIAVAASNSRDQRSDYSNYGKAIAICAPSNGSGGRGIVTADVSGTFMRNGKAIESGYSPGEFTDSFGGTSSATPLVAGVCALVLSANPGLTAAEVKGLLEQTARQIGKSSDYDANGHSIHYGYGCINAQAAVKRALDLLAGSAPAPASQPEPEPVLA